MHPPRRLVPLVVALVAALALAPGALAKAKDTDHDGMPDAWEKAHGLDWRKPNAKADADHDGVSNIREYHLGTDPRTANALCNALDSALDGDSSDCSSSNLTMVLN